MADDGEVHQIRLGDIELRDEFRIRERLHDPTVQQYEAVLAELPPVSLFELDGRHVLVDGFHRVQAHRRLARKLAECRVARLRAGRRPLSSSARDHFLRSFTAEHLVPAHIYRGTLAEARVFAAEANTRHGRGLTPWERYRAIAVVDDAEPGLSLRAVAAKMHVSHETVRASRIVMRLFDVVAPEDVKRLTARQLLAVEAADPTTWPDLVAQALGVGSSGRVSPPRALSNLMAAMHWLETATGDEPFRGKSNREIELLADDLDRDLPVLERLRTRAREIGNGAPRVPAPSARPRPIR